MPVDTADSIAACVLRRVRVQMIPREYDALHNLMKMCTHYNMRKEVTPRLAMPCVRVRHWCWRMHAFFDAVFADTQADELLAVMRQSHKGLGGVGCKNTEEFEEATWLLVTEMERCSERGVDGGSVERVLSEAHAADLENIIFDVTGGNQPLKMLRALVDENENSELSDETEGAVRACIMFLLQMCYLQEANLTRLVELGVFKILSMLVLRANDLKPGTVVVAMNMMHAVLQKVANKRGLLEKLGVENRYSSAKSKEYSALVYGAIIVCEKQNLGPPTQSMCVETVCMVVQLFGVTRRTAQDIMQDVLLSFKSLFALPVEHRLKAVQGAASIMAEVHLRFRVDWLDANEVAVAMKHLFQVLGDLDTASDANAVKYNENFVLPVVGMLITITNEKGVDYACADTLTWRSLLVDVVSKYYESQYVLEAGSAMLWVMTNNMSFLVETLTMSIDSGVVVVMAEMLRVMLDDSHAKKCFESMQGWTIITQHISRMLRSEECGEKHRHTQNAMAATLHLVKDVLLPPIAASREQQKEMLRVLHLVKSEPISPTSSIMQVASDAFVLLRRKGRRKLSGWSDALKVPSNTPEFLQREALAKQNMEEFIAQEEGMKKSKKKRTRRRLDANKISVQNKLCAVDGDRGGTDAGVKGIDAGVKGTDTDAKRTDTDAKRTDADAKRTDTDAKDTDADAREDAGSSVEANAAGAAECSGTLAQEDECVVCMENKASHIFYPCGHLCVCSSCADAIRDSETFDCPICGGNALDVLKVYRP